MTRLRQAIAVLAALGLVPVGTAFGEDGDAPDAPNARVVCEHLAVLNDDPDLDVALCVDGMGPFFEECPDSVACLLAIDANGDRAAIDDQLLHCSTVCTPPDPLASLTDLADRTCACDGDDACLDALVPEIRDWARRYAGVADVDAVSGQATRIQGCSSTVGRALASALEKHGPSESDSAK